MNEEEHDEASKRGDLHSDLCALVDKHGLEEVLWMIGVIKEDREAVAEEPSG